MKFELNSTIILTKEEYASLDNAWKLCRDMDTATFYAPAEGGPSGCDICPLWSTCSKRASKCVFTVAHKALKEIIDMAVVK